MSIPKYDLTPAKRYCAEKGLIWDKDGADHATALARKHDLSNDALNEAIKIYTDQMLRVFTPTNYDWPTRIKMAVGLALLFLGLRKGPGAR